MGRSRSNGLTEKMMRISDFLFLSPPFSFSSLSTLQVYEVPLARNTFGFSLHTLPFSLSPIPWTDTD